MPSTNVPLAEPRSCAAVEITPRSRRDQSRDYVPLAEPRSSIRVDIRAEIRAEIRAGIRAEIRAEIGTWMNDSVSVCTSAACCREIDSCRTFTSTSCAPRGREWCHVDASRATWTRVVRRGGARLRVSAEDEARRVERESLVDVAALVVLAEVR